MFQRLISRILPTGQEATPQQEQQQSHEMSDVNRIIDMGFSEEQALNALLISHNDVSRALEYLLQSLVAPSSPEVQPLSSRTVASNASAIIAVDYSDEDEQLQRALRDSMLVEQNPSSFKAEQINNNHRVKKVGQQGGKKTATSIPIAGNKAGQAAMERLERQKQYGLKGNTTTRSSSNRGKIPLPLSGKSKEEQILRSVNRMSPYPKAVDTMLQAMRRLQQDDSSSTVRHSKFSEIDKSSTGYQKALEGVPGVTDLFLALNFELVANKWTLPSYRAMDKALLWLVTSSLEQVRATNPDYRRAKLKMEFISEVRHMLENAATETCQQQEELRARAVHKNLCPSEPAEGTLHTIIVSIVLATSHSKKKQEEEYDIINSKTASSSTTKTILSRRFHSDDTVRDLLHWLGGNASAIPINLKLRKWCLRDKNRYPSHPISCTEEVDLDKTLQSVGCFPAGLLELDLSDDEWSNHGVNI